MTKHEKIEPTIFMANEDVFNNTSHIKYSINKLAILYSIYHAMQDLYQSFNFDIILLSVIISS